MSNESEFLDRLLKFAPPPKAPVFQGTPNGWIETERLLGTPLPSDYKRIIDVYGHGDFLDLLTIVNPFVYPLRVRYSYLETINCLISTYQSETDPKFCPFSIWPAPGGILPVAADTIGRNMYWLTTGEPDEWTLVLYDWRGAEFEQYPYGLAELLVRWLSGEFTEGLLKSEVDFHEYDPIFLPDNVKRE